MHTNCRLQQSTPPHHGSLPAYLLLGFSIYWYRCSILAFSSVSALSWFWCRSSSHFWCVLVLRWFRSCHVSGWLLFIRCIGPCSISLICELCRISRFCWTTLFTRHNKNNTVGPAFFPSRVLRTGSTQFPVHFCIQITGAPLSCQYWIHLFLST